MKKLSKTSLYRSDTMEAFITRCDGNGSSCYCPPNGWVGESYDIQNYVALGHELYDFGHPYC